MYTLSIAKNLSLPTDIVTQVEVILAKRRAGKSYTMRRIAEQLLKAHQQVVLVDPKGDQWGLRSSADGKKPGFPVLILGGEHGDLPLEVNGGEVVARLVVEERVSVLLDLSQFRKHELATFMTAFLENLYRLKAQEKYRTPMKLIIDEADAIAPQKPQKGEERMLGAIEDIVRRGGQRGIGCTLVTQRSAVLNKNVLTQAQVLIVLRTIAPQDLAAMKAWIDVHGTVEQGKELMESLPSLPIGDAWFWSPGWPTDEGIFKRVHVLPIETFDSGATPKPGEKKIVPKNLADVDLDALKGAMAATIEKKKADDPKLLHAEIARLTAELGKQKPLTNEQLTKLAKPFMQAELKERMPEIEKIIIARRDKEWIENSGQWKTYAKQLLSIIKKVEDAIGSIGILGGIAMPPDKPDLKNHGDGVKIISDKAYEIKPTSDGMPLQLARHDPGFAKRSEARFIPNPKNIEPAGEVVLKAGARDMLAVLVSRYPMKMNRSQFATLSGKSPKSSTFDQYLAALKRAGMITVVDGNYIPTQEGIDACGGSAPAPKSAAELRDMWRSKLKAGAWKLLEVLIENAEYSAGMSKQELAERAVQSFTSSTFDQYLALLKRNGLIVSNEYGITVTPELL